MKKDYWKGRFDQIEQAANNQAVDYYHKLERKYEKFIYLQNAVLRQKENKKKS